MTTVEIPHEAEAIGNDDGPIQRGEAAGQAQGGVHRGGGPRSPEGRQASSRNATTHGITSNSPVVDGESSDEWFELLDGNRAHFQPNGTFEERTVYFISLDQRLLDRVHRSIEALTSLRFEAVDPRPLVHRLPTGPDPNDYIKPGPALAVLQSLDRFDDSAPVGEELLIDLLRAVLTSGSTKGVELPAPTEEPPAQQIGRFRGYVAQVAQSRGQTVDEVVAAAMSALDMELFMRDARERQQETEKKRLAARAYLPDYRDMDTLLRYKRQIEGSIERNIRLLEHSQRARVNDLPAPIRLEISDG